MADPDDTKKFMGIPGWVWDKLFMAIALAIIGYLANGTKTAVENNGVENKVAHETIKEKLGDVKTAVAANTAVMQSAPPTSVIVEQRNERIETKAADVPADEPLERQ